MSTDILAFNNNTNKTMSSLEIAELTGKRHEDVVRDIKNILLQAEIEATKFCVPSKMPSGQTALIYNLPKRECDLVISGYSVKYRLLIIDRWTELENEQAQPKLPTNYLEALEDLVEKEKLIQYQRVAIENKDSIIIASNEASIKAGEILVREFVKSVDIIELGEKQFYQWMREQSIICKKSTEPYQHFVKLGYFTYKPSEEKLGGHIRYTLRITPRGKVWLSNRYMKYIDAE